MLVADRSATSRRLVGDCITRVADFIPTAITTFLFYINVSFYLVILIYFVMLQQHYRCYYACLVKTSRVIYIELDTEKSGSKFDLRSRS